MRPIERNVIFTAVHQSIYENLMSKLQIILLIIFSSLCASAQTSVTTIAKENGSSISFVIDTVAYKKFVSTQLLDSGYDVAFDKIEVKRQMTLGSKREFFYLLLTSKMKKIKVARWLNKQGNEFLTNDELGEDDVFEQLYLTCVGGGNCSPHVFEDKDIRMWGCSDVLGCNAVEGAEPKCLTLQSIF